MAEEYRIIERISDQSVKLEFAGVFEGKEITWDARIKTLSACYLDLQGREFNSQHPVELRQFIEIRECNQSYHAEIGLNLKQIDEPAIKRTIIMMRKYKRLHLGRHEYGEAISFEAETG